MFCFYDVKSWCAFQLIKFYPPLNRFKLLVIENVQPKTVSVFIFVFSFCRASSHFIVVMKFKRCFGFCLGESVKQATFVSGSSAKKYFGHNWKKYIRHNWKKYVRHNWKKYVWHNWQKEVRKIQVEEGHLGKQIRDLFEGKEIEGFWKNNSWSCL